MLNGREWVDCRCRRAGRRRYRFLAAGAACLLAAAGARISCADSPAAEPAPEYTATIKPIFAKYCAECHGAQKQKAGLRLDYAKGILAGGDSGPALVAKDSASSLLIQALRGAEGVATMPPEGKPRPTDAEIDLIAAWIDQGAAAPDDEPAPQAAVPASSHWSFQPIVRPAVPAPKRADWARNPIDAFILARLEREGLAPSSEADRATLIRRLYLDLQGLLPPISEVDAFLQDARPNAYELLVERLLDSPHYGERWGRHWLDLARYADSNGFTRDFARSIWPYRDWVIDAVARDVPFDQFVIEQIAGDMLPGATMANRIATGFHRNTLINEEGGTDPEQFRVESVVDRVNTTALVFLGLTLGCAQCHDHKYDPFTQRDYYRLYAFLNNCDEPKLEVPSEEQVRQGLPQKREALRAQIAELEQQFSAHAQEFQQALDAWEKSLTEDDKKKLPPLVLNVVNMSLAMREAQNTKELADYYKTLPQARQQFPMLETIARLRASEPQFVTTMVMAERSVPRQTHVHLRGDFLRKGALVEPGVPAVLPGLDSTAGPPNRLDFARWLVSPRNPLTPRVTMNRVWQKLMGRGIVETENDFGTQGTPPTHPELLDWLAAEFVRPATLAAGSSAEESAGRPAAAMSLKHMLRLIVNSATYRQSSRFRADLVERDPLNKLYARQARARLDAEILRDAALSASGLLTRTIGGPSVFPPQPEGVFDFTQDKKPWNTAVGPDRYRRGMYTYLWRSSPYPAMSVFDFPDANVTCTRRNRSNTPLQSLTLANDQQFLEFAQGLAQRVLSEAPADDGQRLRFAFRSCLAREPHVAEEKRLRAFLDQQRSEFGANLKQAEQLAPPLLAVRTTVQEFASWTAVARALLNLDEFITRE